MFNPSMFGLTAEQMAAGKEVGNHLRMEIRVHHQEERVEVQHIPITAEDAKEFDMRQAVDRFAEQLAWGHHAMFGMQGKIVDVD